MAAAATAAAVFHCVDASVNVEIERYDIVLVKTPGAMLSSAGVRVVIEAAIESSYI